MSKYISAEKFVNKILENKLMSRESVAMRIFEIIKNLPSVDVAEIKHGKWEYTALVDCELSEVKCSNCKFKITSTADIAVVGVAKWEDIKGHYVRVKQEDRLVVGIGNIIKDKWFEPREFFKEIENE